MKFSFGWVMVCLNAFNKAFSLIIRRQQITESLIVSSRVNNHKDLEYNLKDITD